MERFHAHIKEAELAKLEVEKVGLQFEIAK